MSNSSRVYPDTSVESWCELPSHGPSRPEPSVNTGLCLLSSTPQSSGRKRLPPILKEDALTASPLTIPLEPLAPKVHVPSIDQHSVPQRPAPRPFEEAEDLVRATFRRFVGRDSETVDAQSLRLLVLHCWHELRLPIPVQDVERALMEVERQAVGFWQVEHVVDWFISAFLSGSTRHEMLMQPTCQLPIQKSDLMFCLFFRNEDDDSLLGFEQSATAKAAVKAERVRVANLMLRAGLVLMKQLSRDQDELIVRIAVPHDLMLLKATEYKLRVRTKHGEFRPFDLSKPELYVSQPGPHDFNFTDKVKLGVLRRIIHLELRISAERLMSSGVLTQMFPNHNSDELAELQEDWASFRLMCSDWHHQPLDQIRQYFGERIAIYFAFVGFYTQALYWPASLGTALMVAQLVLEGDNFGHHVGVSEYLTVGYTAFLGIWAALFLKTWRRYLMEWSHKWGMRDIRASDEVLPAFQGDNIQGFWKRKVDDNFACRRIVGLCSILLMVVVVALCAGAIIAVQVYVHKEFGMGWLVGIGNGLFISVLNSLSKLISLHLTLWENHRTVGAFEKYLVIKAYVFQFVNSYLALYISAFVKPLGGEWAVDWFGRCTCVEVNATSTCPDDTSTRDALADTALTKQGCTCNTRSCHSEVGFMLLTIFLVNLLLQNLVEHLYPWLRRRSLQLQESFELKDDEKLCALTAVEKESKLAPYDAIEVFDDYNELVIQFGYMTFFATNFPVVALFAVINNLVEIRSDALKLCVHFQRPFPLEAEDEGLWGAIITVASFVAVTTNCAYIFFVMEWSQSYDAAYRVLWFFLAEHAIYFTKLIVEVVIPDEPAGIKKARQKERDQGKLIDHEMALVLWEKLHKAQFQMPDPTVEDDDEYKPLTDIEIDAKLRQILKAPNFVGKC